ncbi:protein NPGR1 [Vigna radiata var. radiata]|uniref:Protein NPGR1 n=1 Tax=Vigna radiata var. radiata TaxID=3916 RepID=A0A1S3U921_VIGRR|nr:protein NPGR1 [Vigna radiata var. radiata]XP_014502514.1 protein NPGR1 [Vigna radiata var. radiata]XP_014502515.1 protein NPGR1 [Vigna radiata var. radiata]XP_014502516.1 protein NPGR1 [Vigna radiata var. radiata]XP_022638242.1 protein NPGR1 [Vigna radiata var. radiata]
MLCACSGEQFKFEEAPQSPESLATRDFSASGLSSRTGDWESKFDETQVEEAESTLKETLSLNYEEARALLGRLEYQRGNFDAALQVFEGIDIRVLAPRMIRAIAERTKQRKPRSKVDNVLPNVMSMHSVSLLLEAILLKSKSLEELGRYTEAAKECRIIVDTVESALPKGMPEGIGEDCKLQEMFHKALELLPNLWIKSGFLEEAVTAYRRALIKPWNLEPWRLARVQKDLATTLLYGGAEVNIPSQLQVNGLTTPMSGTEEAILLLLILSGKMALQEIDWDPEIMDHLTFSLSVTGMFESLADNVEKILPGVYDRAERWHFLALCYSAAGQNEVALNLLRKACGSSEAKHRPYFPSFLFAAKLCSLCPNHAHEGIKFSQEVIDLAKHQNEHFLGEGLKFMGTCQGAAARVSVLDSERIIFQRESLYFLNDAVALNGNNDPEVILSLGLENAIQRNLNTAYDNLMIYSDMMAGSSKRGWQLLALIVSAEQRFKDAETIVDFALDEAGSIDQLELLRLKAILQITQQQPKKAVETYRILLAVIESQKEHWLQAKAFRHEALKQQKLEMEVWQDLATIYVDLCSFLDAKACVDKAQLIEFFSPRSWHITGLLFESRTLHKEALASFLVSLSIEPDYIPSIISAAKLMLKLGMQSLPIARSFLMNALRLDPTNHEAWFNLGLVSKMEGSLQQAADCFQAAYELKLSAPVQEFE